jgi:stage II sporulation protein D
VPVPPWLHAATVVQERKDELATKDTEITKITKRRALAFVAFVIFVVNSYGAIDGQSGRTVAVGSLSGASIVTLPLEEYVARVLAGEGQPNAPESTQQALAIAIRTYAVFNTGRHRRDGFDLCDTTHCQVPRTATAASRRAALATAGRVLIYQGAPAEIFYSASCGGRSENAADVWPTLDLPYLRSVSDDVHGDEERWVLERTLEQVERLLQRYNFQGSLRGVEIDDRTDSGRVAKLRLPGLRPDGITGEQLRFALGASELRSTAFSVDRRGRTVRFTGRGYGHGVGLCIVGAGRRGERGQSADAILRHYYPGLIVGLLD